MIVKKVEIFLTDIKFVSTIKTLLKEKDETNKIMIFFRNLKKIITSIASILNI
jgi:hypothetical protein